MKAWLVLLALTRLDVGAVPTEEGAIAPSAALHSRHESEDSDHHPSDALVGLYGLLGSLPLERLVTASARLSSRKTKPPLSSFSSDTAGGSGSREGADGTSSVSDGSGFGDGDDDDGDGDGDGDDDDDDDDGGELATTSPSESDSTSDNVSPQRQPPNSGQRSLLQFYVTGSRNPRKVKKLVPSVPDSGTSPISFRSRLFGGFSNQQQLAPDQPHVRMARLLEHVPSFPHRFVSLLFPTALGQHRQCTRVSVPAKATRKCRDPVKSCSIGASCLASNALWLHWPATTMVRT
jgi:hypothetical protein